MAQRKVERKKQMTEKIKNALSGVKSGWDKIDAKRKKILIGAVLAVVIAGSVLGVTGSSVDYSLLFSNMELSDAGMIVADLETKGIKYKLEDNGQTILIEQNQVDSYRMDLAVNDMLPESSTGFEIFDNTGLMVTDEDRQIMYQRALTGELQRTISSLEGINSAKVHLVMPEKSIFETEARSASASVVVETSTGYKINENTIRGIASLVSGAVDNMPMENIQIIDSNGVLLSSFLTQDDAANLSSTLEQYSSARSSFQKEIEGKLLSLLGSVYGYDKIRVSVLAELDFNAEESTTINYYDPLVRSEQVSATGSDIDQQQVTGGSLDDNISNVFEGEEGRDQTFSKTTNNELSSETTSTIKAPGQVKRLTTSVVYGGRLDDDERENIQSIVAAAIGYDGDRGDLVSVVGVASAEVVEEPPVIETPEPSFYEENQLLVLGGSGILALILLIVIIVTTKRRKKRRAQEELEIQREIERGISIADAFDEADIDDIVMKPDQKSAKAQKYAQEHPDLAADLIKAWIRE